MKKRTKEEKLELLNEACDLFREAAKMIEKAKWNLHLCGIETCGGFNEKVEEWKDYGSNARILYRHDISTDERGRRMIEKLISADRVLCFIERDSDLLASCGEEQTVDDVIAIIKSAPAVDAVDVVRCKDCIYSENYDDSTYRPDYFCADGERRDDNAID